MLDSQLTSSLTDIQAAALAGGFANPINKGKGSVNSGDSAADVYTKTPSGVANSNHYFNQGGAGRTILNEQGLNGQGQWIRLSLDD